MTVRLSRRKLMGSAAAGAVVALLAACGETPAPTPTIAPAGGNTPPATPLTPALLPTAAPAPAATVPPAPTSVAAAPVVVPATTATATPAVAPTPLTTAATTTATATAPPAAFALIAPPLTRTLGPSKGELRLALGFDFPAKVDALKDTKLLIYGVSETLARLNEQNRLEPMLAERIVNVSPTVWRVTLRGAKFHDGSPVTPEDVIAAFRKNWDNFPDLKGLISPETKIAKVDERTLEFVTPQPSAIFPYALTLNSTTIHKPTTPGGTDGGILTGAYRVTKLVVDNECVLEPFADHWAGVPPIARISMRFVGDANARVLALQSGDTDMLYNFPPEAIKAFGPEFEVIATPSGRISLVNLNVGRPPFNDREVREAYALGVDRAALNTIGLDGRGLVCEAMFPPIAGYDTVPLQGTDTARARQLLDNAGWKMGADGVRAKGKDRLALTLYSYPGRSELTPYAVTMKEQLKPLGFEIKVAEVQAIATAVKDGNYEAAMRTNNILPTGNPLYIYNRLLQKGGGENTANYVNPKIEELLAQMRGELDPAKARMLSLAVQEVLKQDVPMVFLTAVPITAAYRKGKVRGYIPNPNDAYLLNTAISVTER